MKPKQFSLKKIQNIDCKVLAILFGSQRLVIDRVEIKVMQIWEIAVLSKNGRPIAKCDP